MKHSNESAPVVIAVCGKGGVGKTSVSALITGALAADTSRKVLAIDADPAVGLAGALGMPVRKTVDDIRKSLIAEVTAGTSSDRQTMAARLDYDVFDALEERGNLAFLAVGRPEQEGCYCQVNRLLKEIIATMARSFDYVIIDGEAGVEQINRRVMSSVTHLLLVSDASARGLQVARTIEQVAREALAFDHCGLVLNRIRGPEEASKITIPTELNLLGWLNETDSVRTYDMEGRSLLTLPAGDIQQPLMDCLSGIGLPLKQKTNR